MWELRQSTASQEIPLGYFVDSTDGNTAETGLTIANTDIKLFKTGATSLANKNSGGATHMAGGMYYAVLDATDTDTLGPMRVSVHVAGALAVHLDCIVRPANYYDSIVANVEFLEVAGFAQKFDATVSPAEFYERDGTTVQFSKTLATDAGADPIVGSS